VAERRNARVPELAVGEQLHAIQRHLELNLETLNKKARSKAGLTVKRAYYKQALWAE
jgi:hypothetical protein